MAKKKKKAISAAAQRKTSARLKKKWKKEFARARAVIKGIRGVLTDTRRRGQYDRKYLDVKINDLLSLEKRLGQQQTDCFDEGGDDNGKGHNGHGGGEGHGS